MEGSEIKVGTRSDGMKAIIATDLKSGLRVIIPLDEVGAKAVATALNNNLVIVPNLPRV